MFVIIIKKMLGRHGSAKASKFNSLVGALYLDIFQSESCQITKTKIKVYFSIQNLKSSFPSFVDYYA